MLRWEYAVIKATLLSGWEVEYADRKETIKEDIEAVLNRLGPEGWELTAVTCDQMGTPKRFFLKRSHGNQG
jgi:hypothetical protein